MFCLPETKARVVFFPVSVNCCGKEGAVLRNARHTALA